jgi:predicted adenylyl cyclase CyaB
MKLIEIKALCLDMDSVRIIALNNGFKLFGIDEQSDTYFKVNNGILKIRDAKIERTMIYYNKEKKVGPRMSELETYNSCDQEKLKKILSDALGVIGIIKKHREIYTKKNKILHLDRLLDGRQFVEIEISGESTIKNRKICDNLMKLFRILPDDITNKSYFELVMGYEI